REGVRFGNQNLWPFRAVSADEHGGGAITEENGRNEIGLGNILALKCERGKFDGDDEHITAGVGLEEIGGASQGHRTSRATEFRERHAANIGAETHEVDEMG